jgi:hypothetical protein
MYRPEEREELLCKLFDLADLHSAEHSYGYLCIVITAHEALVYVIMRLNSCPGARSSHAALLKIAATHALVCDC